MAVVDKYTDSNREAGTRSSGSLLGGAKIVPIFQTFEVAAGDDDGSIYRLATLASNDRIVEISYGNDGITGGDDYDLGFYEVGTTTEGDKDKLVDGGDLSSASTGLGGDGMSSVNVADIGKPVWELVGGSEDDRKEYDVAWTANTVGTAAGTVSTRLYVIRQN